MGLSEAIREGKERVSRCRPHGSGNCGSCWVVGLQGQ